MNAAIEMRGVVKRYPGFQLGPLDLEVPRGAIYGLIGPNGAGKTTAIDMIFGMGQLDAGEIRVLGLDHRAAEVEMKRRAGYVSPELNYAAWGRVWKVIRFVRGFYPDWDDDYCARLMKEFGLHEDEKVSAMSFGAKTKLSLLLALARRPEVLVLDEPTTGLDAVSKQQMFGELLKAVETGERSVLISSHGLGDIERFADHVGMIKRGKLLLEGRMDAVVERFRYAEFACADGARMAGRDGFIVLKRGGERWQGLLDLASGAREWLDERGAREMTLTRVTLEDLFVALVREDAEVTGPKEEAAAA